MRPALAPLLLLAACGPKPEGNAGGNAAQTSPAAETPIAPGRWEIRTSQASPPRVGGRIVPGGGSSEASSDTRCITPEEAAQPTPELLMNGRYPNECKPDTFSLAHGNINGQLACEGHAEDVRTVPTTLSGAYTRDSYWLQIDQSALGISFSTRIDAHRLGDCDD